MTTLVLDVETTIGNKGDPFDERNSLQYVGVLKNGDDSSLFAIQFSCSPYRTELATLGSTIQMASLVVGFNIKFDLHWCRRYGLPMPKKVWDCQLVHFILTKQQHPYPSLNSVASYYQLGVKLDVVKEEYWDKGIDTPNVPKDILEEYLEQDLQLTHQVYLKQVEHLATQSDALKRLVSLHNSDLLVLQEMEFNGLTFNEERCLSNATLLEKEIEEIDVNLNRTCGVVGFNFNSGDHLSSLLYGGVLNFPVKQVIGVYKTGPRKGESKEGWVDYYHTFPQLVAPLKGSELKKEGFFSTDEQTLKSLKCNKEAKKVVDFILTRSTLEKRRGTYFAGFPKLREEHGWQVNYLHGQLNQCVARTGRLSSSRPNLQNIDGQIKDLFYSRYN